MWMTAAITILTILVGIAFAMSGYAFSFGHKPLATQYLITGIALSCVDIFLVVMQATNHAKKLQPKESEKKIEPLEKQNPKLQSSEDYKLDEIVLKILSHIYRDKYSDPVDVLPKELSIDPLEIERRIDKLKEHRYIRYDRNHPFHLSPYTLTPKGRACPFNTPANAIPFPSSEPSATQKEILLLLVDAQVPVYGYLLAQALKLSQTYTDVYLDELVQLGYVDMDYLGLERSPAYTLSSKGKKYIVEKGLIPPQAS